MSRPTSPQSRNVAVTIKVNKAEARVLKSIGGTPGKGLRWMLTNFIWRDGKK